MEGEPQTDIYMQSWLEYAGSHGNGATGTKAHLTSHLTCRGDGLLRLRWETETHLGPI
jgi:hypothetical protein